MVEPNLSRVGAEPIPSSGRSWAPTRVDDPKHLNVLTMTDENREARQRIAALEKFEESIVARTELDKMDSPTEVHSLPQTGEALVELQITLASSVYHCL